MSRTHVVLLGLISAVLSLPLAAQPFNNDYYPQREIHVPDYASGVSVALEDGEGFITVSTVIEEDGSRDAWLHHVDNNGDVVWSRSYGLPERDEWGHGISLSNDGQDVIFTGEARGNLWLFRAEVSTGDMVWSRTYGHPMTTEQGNFVAGYEDGADSGYVAVGQVTELEQIYMVRVREDGTPLFHNRYDMPGMADMPTSFHIRDGFAHVTGLHDQAGFLTSLFIFEIRLSNGFGGAFHFYHHTFAVADRLPMLAPTDDGGFMAAYTLDQFGRSEIAVLRVDAAMSPVWEQRYTGVDPGLPFSASDGFSWGLSIYPTESGEFAIGGSVTRRAYASWMLIDGVGTPLDMRHYRDAGFTDVAGGVDLGDSVTAMSMDVEGFLLKNHLRRGISLTRTDPAGEDTCDVRIHTLDSTLAPNHFVIDYGQMNWGPVTEYEVEIRDLDIDLESCEP